MTIAMSKHEATDSAGQDLADNLRGGVLDGEPMRRLLDSWPAVEAALAGGSEALVEVLGEAAEIDVAVACAAVVAGEAVTLAVVNADNEPLYADRAFRAWFPTPGDSATFRRLARQARAKAPATGLLETADGVMVATWVGAAAGGWPLPDAARLALAKPGAVAVVVFAPSRSSALATRAAEAFDLTPLESRLAAALIFAPTLEIAAARVGVGRETARDAQRRIMAKTGVRRASEVVRRLVDLMCQSGPSEDDDEALLAETLGLTRTEARVALKIAGGLTYAAAGQVLGLTEETVRTYAKSALAKAGVSRGRDLARLTAESLRLNRLAGVAEPIFTDSRLPGRLRVIPSEVEDRRIAFVDYGPARGRPLLVFHGYVQGRTLPIAFVQQLQACGLRPIVPQRPGFGLTDPALADYIETAVADIAALVRRLKAPDLLMLARDGGVTTALAFAARHPALFGGAVLLNPRTPASFTRAQPGIISTVARILLRHPHLISTFAELFRRQTRTDLLESSVRRALSAPADRAAVEDAAVMDQMVRDIQALCARSSSGFAAEQTLYAEGWTPPQVRVGPWTVVHCDGLGESPPTEPWAGLPDVAFNTLAGAGLLAQYTHPEALAQMVAQIVERGAWPAQVA